MLASCMPAPKVAGYRDPARAISSAALFDAARFQGDWQQVAAFGSEGACGVLAETWQADAQGFSVRGTTCRSAARTAFATRARMIGPGRMARPMRDGTEEIWVLWVDADYRIAAIGTPSGRFGRIIARPGQARADLIAAARDVLDFNGYDIRRLKLLR